MEFTEDKPFAAPNNGGLKYDSGKPRPGLVFIDMPRAMTAVSEVMTFGARKYEENSWPDVEDGVKRYTDAMLRHLLAEASGEYHDPESELTHAAHAAVNALIRLELILRRNG